MCERSTISTIKRPVCNSGASFSTSGSARTPATGAVFALPKSRTSIILVGVERVEIRDAADDNSQDQETIERSLVVAFKAGKLRGDDAEVDYSDAHGSRCRASGTDTRTTVVCSTKPIMALRLRIRAGLAS